jgi:hypothetical protein
MFCPRPTGSPRSGVVLTLRLSLFVSLRTLVYHVPSLSSVVFTDCNLVRTGLVTRGGDEVTADGGAKAALTLSVSLATKPSRDEAIT